MVTFVLSQTDIVCPINLAESILLLDDQIQYEHILTAFSGADYDFRL